MAEGIVSCNVLTDIINSTESLLDAENVLVPSLLFSARLTGKESWKITAEHGKWHMGKRQRHSDIAQNTTAVHHVAPSNATRDWCLSQKSL